MGIIIALLALIIVILLFGPVGVAIFAMLGAGIGAFALGLVLCVLLAIVAAYLIGAVLWCVWWCFDRPGAMESIRSAQRAYDAAKASKAGR